MLKAGDRAPALKLSCDDGSSLDVRKPSGKALVVYFYPRDNTPGCTRQAIEFSANAAAFAKAGAVVVGISRDSEKSHQGFRAKHKLTIRLASDPELVAHQAFGAWGEKSMYGKLVLGTIRSTFLIDEGGKVQRVWPKVKVDGHAAEVLAEVLGTGAARPAKPPPAKEPAKAPTAKVSAKTPTAKAPAAKVSAKTPTAKAPAAKAPTKGGKPPAAEAPTKGGKPPAAKPPPKR